MKRFYLLLLSVLVLSNSTAAGFNPRTDLQKLDQWYQQVVDDWDLPGMTIGIIMGGELIFSKGYGVKRVGDPQAPESSTNYQIASNSKAFTAAVFAMLVQEGLLSWDDKVKDHLPWFAVYDPWVTNQVTIRDLLSHRVGYGTFSGDVIWYNSNLDPEQIIRRIRHLSAAFEFRNGYGYSNLMYITAGEVIRAVTGKSWEQNVRERILEPLGMNRTIVRIQDLDATGNFASPHARINGKNTVIDWVDWENVAATGGLISNVEDVSKWMIFNMNHGIWNGDTLLRASSVNLMWTPHNSFVVDHSRSNNFNRHFSAYGLGWGLSDYHGRLSVGHTGGYDGMISEVRMLPKEKIGVVVLTNGTMSPITAVTNYTLEFLLGLEPRDWSAELLPIALRNQQEDRRVTEIKNARVKGTKPTLPLNSYPGIYYSNIYGEITISNVNNQLRLSFEHSPLLSASLHHWHYDVWEIRWDNPQAWFDFGVLKFNLDNKNNIISMDFEVPNRDIFFEELKPVRR
jgi:CubicO group peptidase (beta-lactamase class C family)